MVTVEEVCRAQRAEGTATVMAIGTVNPPTIYEQSAYPNAYFRMTNSEHLTLVKNKMQRTWLDPSIKRVILYQQGCNGGGTILRIAKDLAENTKNASVLIVCVEITIARFHSPSKSDVDVIVSHSLFPDGTAALIVVADPIPNVEKVIFELVSAAPNISA
ncbi:hypothetical protein Pint_07495 [Pistacia integerrima]|uniref:Uncharacterized protein n=1 Tax=Pistacia integerrima TaxID=434235 RepID=A0ACC0XWI1_9ROSI|nr:hypothetical protein Pint_07495 [Pistacia integerrima]